MPTTATLGSFMSKNNFDALRHDSTRNSTTAPVAGTTTTTSLADLTRTLAGATPAANAVKASTSVTTTSPADNDATQTTKTPTTGATTKVGWSTVGALKEQIASRIGPGPRGEIAPAQEEKLKAICVTTIDPEGEASKKAIEDAEGILKNIDGSINSIEHVEGSTAVVRRGAGYRQDQSCIGFSGVRQCY
jgi:hypothetical protein